MPATGLGAAVKRLFLQVVALFDSREIWHLDGATSLAAWLAARLGLSHPAATELCISPTPWSTCRAEVREGVFGSEPEAFDSS